MSHACAHRHNRLSLKRGAPSTFLINHPAAIKVLEDQGQFTIEIAPMRSWNSVSVDLYVILIWSFARVRSCLNRASPQLLQHYLISALTFVFLIILSVLTLARLA
jgi:hypothetical protein